MRRTELTRPPGGRLAQNAYERVNRWVEGDEKAEKNHQRIDKINNLATHLKQQPQTERLKGRVMLKNQRQRHLFEERGIFFLLTQEENYRKNYIENRIRERKEGWESTSSLVKTTAVIKDLSDQLKRSTIGKVIERGLFSQVVSNFDTWIVGRVELHYSHPNPALLPFEKSSNHNIFLKGQQQENQYENNDYVGGFYENDQGEQEPALPPKLSYAAALNAEFLDAFGQHHKKAEKLRNDMNQLIEELRWK